MNSKKKWAQFQQMTLSEKIGYFKDYYLVKTVVVILILILLIQLLITVFRHQPKTILNIAFINYPYTEEIETMETNLNAYFDTKNNDTKITVDTGYPMNDIDTTTTTKLGVLIATQELDIMIAPESKIKQYAEAGTLYPLSDLLPTDLYTELSDHFYCCEAKVDPDSDTKSVLNAYGIYIKDTSLFSKYNLSEDPPVLGVIANTKNSDYVVEFIKFLLDQ